MKRLHALVLGAAMVGIVSPAMACLNDDESPIHEREFRSQYGEFAKHPAAEEPNQGRPIGDRVLLGGGAVLLVGAFALAAKRAR